MESKKRSIAKTFTWRICATLTTIALVGFFSKSLTLAFSVGAFEVLAKLMIYYAHERAWNIVHWGK